jgi:hypothetical protein
MAEKMRKTEKTRKNMQIICIILIFGGILTVSAVSNEGYEIDTFTINKSGYTEVTLNVPELLENPVLDDSKLYQTGGINVVALNGNYYEMDEQYGNLQAKSEIHVYINNHLDLSISDAHISHEKIYNFTKEWNTHVAQLRNLDNVTITITTAKNFTYISSWELYQNGTDISFISPPTIEGESYTWDLLVKDRILSLINFVLDTPQTVQDNAWADLDVNTMDEKGYTRVNVTFTPVIPLEWVDLIVRGGQIIEFTTYPSDFEMNTYTNFVDFYSWEIEQGQTYNFSILVEDPEEVYFNPERPADWVEESLSETITLPVAELGSVTIKADVPVKWEHPLPLPVYAQEFVFIFEEEKPTHTDAGVTVDVELFGSSEIEPLLPASTNLSNAIVIKLNVTDNTPENSTDDAYTDITINVGALDVGTCKVYKEGSGFLSEVNDVATLPTLKVPGEAKFSRDVGNNSVVIRLYVGDQLLGVISGTALIYDSLL